jgi:plasmid maintenance system antidote protein VapI
MNTSIELVNNIKARYNLPSDYAVAKKLGVTPSSIQHITKSRRQFGDSTAFHAAKLLEMNPVVISYKIRMERTASVSEKAELEQEIRRIEMLEALKSQGFKAVLEKAASNAVDPAEAKLMRDYCILCKIGIIPTKQPKH